ncbi:AI-2E family transporter [Serinicoccus sp. CUA-874]|uniref:AI-2E family transporter n=1 Tax=Serinicoccus sp. CUA-874 TaxID=1517939 RepID=UPI00095C34DD|nr:AI-2E family transporter [Serinicoccus sp. CUA-874]OLT17354.1 AI-2E family transporter [Serinicoccus sp. CUA-874]
MPILPPLRRREPERRGVESPAPAATPAAPTPWPRAVVVLLGVALAFAVLLGLHQLRDYVAPVFLALNLVLAAAPLQRWLVGLKVPGPLAAVTTGAAIFTFLIGFFTALGWSAAAMVEELSSREYRQRYTELYTQAVTFLEGYGLQQDTLTEQLESALDPSRIIGALGGVLSNLTGILGLLTTTAIVIFFLMIDTMSAGRRLSLVKDQHPDVAHALVSFARGVRRYWVVTTIFGLVVALLDVIALVWLGVPLALAWGVLSFLTNYIPNIGFVIGLVPPAVVALLANGPVNALLVVVVYSVLNFVVQSLIQPKFTGDAVGVTPTITFISLVVWAWVLGPVGALLALPATLLLKAVLIDADPAARWVNAFLASNPDTARAETTRESFEQGT